MYVCMIAFILVAVTSILQAYAVIEMVPFALGTSIILLIICWFMELIGGILIIIYGVEQSPALTNSLDTVFFRLIYDYDINPRSSRILTIIQEYVSRKTSTRYWQSCKNSNLCMISYLNVSNNRYTAVDQTDQKIILVLTRLFHGLVVILSLGMSTHRAASRF